MSAGGPEFGFCMSLGESVSVTSGFAKGLMGGGSGTKHGSGNGR